MKLTLNQIRDLLTNLYGGIITLDESTYIATNKRARFVDSDYGEWWALPSSVIYQKKGHKQRSLNEIKNKCLNRIKMSLVELYGDSITIDESTYIGTNKRARFIDKTHGEWWARPNNVLRRKQGHPKTKTERTKATFVLKYGTDNPMKNEKIRNKAKHTNLERYGFENPMSNSDVQNKSKSTALKHWGFECPLSCQQIIQKRYDTNEKRYGTKNPCQNLEVARKSARNQTRAVKLNHWKTGEELVCIGSYEVKVIVCLNSNHIEYSWQAQIFSMPPDNNGKIKTYRPDLYLVGQDKWVEIKGYFRKDAQEKWDWFHSNHTNSELWNKTKLIELGIL